MSLVAPKPASPLAMDGGRIFDLVERGFLLALAVGAVLRLGPSVPKEPQVLLILISDWLAIAFILLRRRAQCVDFSPYAALVAFVGTAAPLLVVAPGHGVIDARIGGAVMSAGLVLNIAAKLALNRSFGLAAANRGVKRAGPYRLVRHPMYAGYVTTQVAFLLLNPHPWNLAVYALGWSMQILRIRAEERVLLQDEAYRAYAAKTRYRLIPGLY
jgi:protein-S-isoprenylcysteine O-methyltransferase Ste14